MASTSYTPHVVFPAPAPSTARQDRRRKPSGAAIRGILVGAPIAAMLWAPIIWGMTKLI